MTDGDDRRVLLVRVPRLATNERSIFIMSIGKSFRCWKDE